VPKIVRTRYEYEGRTRERITVVEEDDLPVWDAEAALLHVGRPHPRVDAAERVSGAARYTADVQLPGMLFCRILRSPHARARVRAVDTTEAERLPGVALVLTPDNIPDDLPQPLQRELYFHGAEVAAVVAESPEQAEDALHALRVEYEVLEPVLTLEEAMAEGAPQASERGNVGNRGKPHVWQYGDPDRAFSEAEVIVSREYRTQVALHNALEPHGTVAWWQGDRLTVWESTQDIRGVQDGLASAYGLPRDRVRVIAEYVGGGFGAKFGPNRHTHVAVIASRLTGRPVYLVLDRHEENLATGNRPATVQHLRIGARRDGRLVAITLRSYALEGAGGGGGTVGGPVRDLYRCDHVRTEEYSVYTSAGPASAFRAPGYPEGAFALESALDELAEQLGMDPLELRRINYAETRRGTPFTSNSLLEAYRVGAEAIGWHRRAEMAAANRGQRHRRGLGVAVGCWGSAGWPPAHAWVQINQDGTITVTSATQDIGTGSKTALALVAAEEMGVPVEHVSMRIGDTLGAPHGTGSGGSGTVASMAPAVRAAAADARRQLLELASAFLDAPADALVVRDGVIRAEGLERTVTVRDLLREVGPVNIIGRGGRAPNPQGVAIIAIAVHFAEVVVDTWTGEVTPVRIVAVHESGRVINPLTMSSQIEGGVVMGTGYALMEERVQDPLTGRILNANLENYHICTVMDTPRIEAVLLDVPDGRVNNAGVKGIGEPPMIPPAPAICNAIYHACGVRVTRLPVTREQILEGLRANGEAGGLRPSGSP
jgi:CO/xanthine dehydrogenase Mo-binding subunit